MKQPNESRPTILEGIGFSLLGTIYSGFMFNFIDAVYNHDLDNQPGVVADYPREITLGLLWIIVGLIVSYFLIRFSLSNLSNLYCWLFTILFASILAVFIQNLYLTFFMIREYPGSPQLVSYWFIPNMFLLLIPFTFLFTNWKYLIDKIRNRNSLR